MSRALSWHRVVLGAESRIPRGRELGPNLPDAGAADDRERPDPDARSVRGQLDVLAGHEVVASDETDAVQLDVDAGRHDRRQRSDQGDGDDAHVRTADHRLAEVEVRRPEQAEREHASCHSPGAAPLHRPDQRDQPRAVCEAGPVFSRDRELAKNRSQLLVVTSAVDLVEPGGELLQREPSVDAMLAKNRRRVIAFGVTHSDGRQVPAAGSFLRHTAKSTVRLRMAEPTPFPDLNAVLADFLASVQEILGENFCGAYLQGSFAVGDADEHSDVDYIVVTHADVSDGQVSGLQGMHERLFELETPWAQHLEGSYFPKELLRRVDLGRTPLVYFDNGETKPARDNHCNTAIVRWSLREHGVTLAGPEPKKLIDPVSADEVRNNVRIAMAEWVEYASMPTKAGGMSQRVQALIVLSFCRILQTLESGKVTSKKVAGEWALDALDPGWKGLIQQALTDRPDQWGQVHRPAAPEDVERTFAFIDYALSKASASG